MAKPTGILELERRGGVRPPAGEEPVELRRYLAALRRSFPLIVGIVLVLAGSIYVVSASLPKRYTARATVAQQGAPLTEQPSNADIAARELNTLKALLTTHDVLAAAARKLPGENADSLAGKVRARVVPDANVINVTVTDSDPAHAAAVANTLADTFVAEQAKREGSHARRAIGKLRHELHRLQATPGSEGQAQSIQDQISNLRVTLAGAGTDLRVAKAAPPRHADTPHPLRNALVGIVLGLFLGVLVALARDQLAPRAGGSRELSRLLGLPVLASVPRARQGSARPLRGASGIEHEGYGTLATLLRLSLPPVDATTPPRLGTPANSGGRNVVLVTSTVHGEGKSTVTARLGRALAHGGHRTLVVSADLRSPTLHDLLGVPSKPGVAELLDKAAEAAPADLAQLAAESVQRAPGERRAGLDVLPTGRMPADPDNVLDYATLDAFFGAIASLGYDYVLVDAPALLGSADAQALARHCTSVLYVARPKRLPLDHVIDARDVLDRIDSQRIGIVVIGGRRKTPAYRVSDRVPELADV
jgi:Mrp family chromosome partitioning ATPase